MNFPYKPRIVDVGIRTQPVGVTIQAVMIKCIEPVLKVRDYRVEFKPIGISWDWEKKIKLYHFQFRILAADHQVSQQEAEDLVRNNIVRWLDV